MHFTQHQTHVDVMWYQLYGTAGVIVTVKDFHDDV